MNDKKTLTLVVETNGTDECRWVFRCYSRRLINVFEGERYGISIMNIDEGDIVTKCRKVETDRNELAIKVEQLEGKLNTLTKENEELEATVNSLQNILDDYKN